MDTKNKCENTGMKKINSTFDGHPQKACRRCYGSGLEPDHVTIGLNMRRRRLDASMTLKDLAEKLDVTKAHCSDLELGKRTWTPDKLAAWFDATVTNHAPAAR